MKTIVFTLQSKLSVMLTLCLVFMLNPAKSQFTPLAKDQGPPYYNASQLIQYQLSGWGQAPLLCIGNDFTTSDPPRAMLHIRKPVGVPSLFKVEREGFGSIENFLTINTRHFAIYQTTTSDSVFNYIESPFTSGLNFYGQGLGIGVCYSEPFRFTSQLAPSGITYTPMKLYHWGIQITDTLVCNNFRLDYQSGLGKVLVSDRVGNGIWSDPSVINNDWFFNRYGDLYANISNKPYHNVGIGFQGPDEKIYERLHIVDGNILISPLHGGCPASQNGSILFGDQVTDDCPNGRWGIEYYTGGLNFWKVYCNQGDMTKSREDIDNYVLFLKDDHTVGVGTNNTNNYKLNVHGNAYFDGPVGIGTDIPMADKLAVNGSIICTELKVRLHDNWIFPDYVLNHNYKLESLSDLEDYINKNQHLPGFPTADEVTKKGLNVGEINVELVKKVEELTKYIIDLQKQVDELKSSIVKH